MLFKKARRDGVYLYYPALHPLALPPISADVLAQLQRYRHLLPQPPTSSADKQPTASAPSPASSSPPPPSSSSPSASAASPADPLELASAAVSYPSAPPSTASSASTTGSSGGVGTDFGSLTALWTTLLLESSVAPLDAIQSFSTTLLSILHPSEEASTSHPPFSPSLSSSSPSSSASLRSSLLAHLHAHTTRTLRTLRSIPILHIRTLHLHILLSLTFPPSPPLLPSTPTLPHLFRQLDAHNSREGYDFLRLSLTPRFGQGGGRRRLVEVCEENFYPLPMELADRSGVQVEEEEEDEGEADASVLPLTRQVTVIAPASGQGLGRSFSSVLTTAPPLSASLTFVEPSLPLSVPAQLAAHRQQRMLSLARVREDDERLRKEARAKRQGRGEVGMKRRRSTEEEKEGEKPVVAITRFSTGIRIHTHMQRQDSAAPARPDTEEKGAGRGDVRRGARKLTFDGCAPVAPSASLTSLSSRASSASLSTPLTTPPLSSSFRSSPQEMTPIGPSSSRSRVASSPAPVDTAYRSPRPALAHASYIAETPQTRQLRRSGGASGSSTSRSGTSARSSAGPSKRSLAATFQSFTPLQR